jgi:hypothetical protein
MAGAPRYRSAIAATDGGGESAAAWGRRRRGTLGRATHELQPVTKEQALHAATELARPAAAVVSRSAVAHAMRGGGAIDIEETW